MNKIRESVFTGSFYCKISQTCTTTFLLTCDRIYSEVLLWDFIARNEVMIWRLKSSYKKTSKSYIIHRIIIKIGTSQFYSHEQERLITVTIISTPVFRPTKRGEWKDCDYEILRTASQYDVVMCLKEIWEAVRK